MERDLSSKIRALEFASRCLSREAQSLRIAAQVAEREGSRTPPLGEEAVRLVKLSRAILDPTLEESAIRPRGSGTDSGRSAGRASEVPPALPSPTNGSFLDRAPSEEHVLALQGQGTVLPIPELIGFIGAVGKSGILRVETAEETFTLEFKGGDIVHGEASRAPRGHRLGDLLVEMGAIEREELESILEGGRCFPLGRHLLRRKLITRAQLTEVLRIQIQALFNRLFRTEKSRFSFWSGPPLHAEEGVRLNTTSVLLEGARASDEEVGQRKSEEAKAGTKAELEPSLFDPPALESETDEEIDEPKSEDEAEDEAEDEDEGEDEDEPKAESAVPAEAEAVTAEAEVAEEKE